MSSPSPFRPCDLTHRVSDSPQDAHQRDENGSVMDVLVVVPLFNGGPLWKQSAEALARARRASCNRVRVKVVDSSSTDDSVSIAQACGFDVSRIDSVSFDHGGTRNDAVMGEPADIYLFLTQDAILESPSALDALVAAFTDSEVAVAYGRQLPHLDANPIAAHARRFNYGRESRVVGLDDRQTLGIKTVFTSNSFAAYRAEVFAALGGFPERTILSEDMYLAARAVMEHRKVAYVAHACVRHSHNYSPLAEFRRYFDIGVFQADHSWISEAFGAAEGEGMRFVKSEMRSLLAQAPLWLPRAFLHNALKILGYRLGRNYRRLPAFLLPKLSMQPRHWAKR